MNKKERKRILETGMDAQGATYTYICPKCGTMNPLNVQICGYCGKKRPRDAFENSQVQVPQPAPVYGTDIDRTARNAYPTAPQLLLRGSRAPKRKLRSGYLHGKHHGRTADVLSDRRVRQGI